MRSVGRQTLLVFTEQGVCALAALIGSIFIARALGVNALGEWKIIMSAQTISGYLLGFGLTLTMSRFLAELLKSDSQKIYLTLIGKLALFRFLTLILSSVFSVFIWWALPNAKAVFSSDKLIALILVVSFYLINDLLGKAVFSGVMCRHIVSYTLILTRVSLAVALSALFFTGFLNLFSAIVALICCYFLEFLIFVFSIYFFVINKKLKIKKLPIGYAERMRKFSFNQYMFHILQVFRENSVDSLMILFMVGLPMVGIHSAGVTIPNLVRMFSPAKVLSGLIFPLLVVEKDSNKYNIYFGLMQKLTLILVLPVVAFCFVWADIILQIILGNQFLVSVPILQISILFIAVSAACDPFFTISIAMEKNVLMRKVSWWGLVNLVLNLFMIPVWGAFGAALSTGAVALGVYFHFYKSFFSFGMRLQYPVFLALKVFGVLAFWAFLTFFCKNFFSGFYLCVVSFFVLLVFYLFFIRSIQVFNSWELGFVRKVIGIRACNFVFGKE